MNASALMNLMTVALRGSAVSGNQQRVFLILLEPRNSPWAYFFFNLRLLPRRAA
jgi:hypothetical protein